MKNKILGNWTNEHSARFNAMIGASVLMIVCYIAGALHIPLLFLMFMAMNGFEAGCAYRFAKEELK